MLKDVLEIAQIAADTAKGLPKDKQELVYAKSRTEVEKQLRYRRNRMRRYLRKLGFKPTGNGFTSGGGSRYERWLHPTKKSVNLSNIYLESEARGHQLPHGMEKIEFFPTLEKLTDYLREDTVDVLKRPGQPDLVLN